MASTSPSHRTVRSRAILDAGHARLLVDVTADPVPAEVSNDAEAAASRPTLHGPADVSQRVDRRDAAAIASCCAARVASTRRERSGLTRPTGALAPVSAQ